MQIKNTLRRSILPEASAILLAVILFLAFLSLLPRINLTLALNSKQNYDYVIKHYSKTNPEKALRLAMKWADATPGNPFYQLEAGILSFKSGDMNTAEAYVRKAGEMFYFPYTRYPHILSDYHCAKMSEAYIYHGRILMEKNRLSEALFYFQYASDVFPDSYQGEIKPLLEEHAKHIHVTDDPSLLVSEFYRKNMDIYKASDNLSTFTSQTLPEANKMSELGFLPLLTQDRLLRAENASVTRELIPLYHGKALVQYKVPAVHREARLFHVIARGTHAKGIWPVLEITVNDDPPHLIYINNANWRAYPLLLDLGKSESAITLRFPNDGCYGYKLDDKTGKGMFTENRDVFVNNIWYRHDE